MSSIQQLFVVLLNQLPQLTRRGLAFIGAVLSPEKPLPRGNRATLRLLGAGAFACARISQIVVLSMHSHCNSDDRWAANLVLYDVCYTQDDGTFPPLEAGVLTSVTASEKQLADKCT